MLRTFIIALVFALISAPAFAADTATVDVTATIPGSCAFSATNYAMAFPAIDPAGTGDVTATATLTFTCNMTGAITSFSDVSGAQTMTGSVPANTLAYSIDAYVIPVAATVGVAQNLTLTGRIADTAYSVAVADSYTDALTVSITP